ncbi:MAG TPA: hypothetical protein VF817_03265 [Patescibacteria group bacterium]
MKKFKDAFQKNKKAAIAGIVVVILVGAYGAYRIDHHLKVLEIKKAEQKKASTKKPKDTASTTPSASATTGASPVTTQVQ